MRDRVLELRRVPASELVPHPENWRRHPETQERILRDVLGEVGFADVVLARPLEDGRLQIIDGHLRADVAGDAEVPVVVLDVDEAEARKLLLSLDPLAALAETSGEELRALLERVQAESGGMAELLKVLEAQAGPRQGRTDPDEIPVRPEPRTSAGDLYVLGGHRLVCGDSRDPDVVARLMRGEQAGMVFTDPPYGVEYQGGTEERLAIRGDERDMVAVHDLLVESLSIAARYLEPGGPFYVCSPTYSRQGAAFRDGIRDAGLVEHQVIAWVKDRFVLSRLDYQPTYEAIFYGWAGISYGWKEGAAHTWLGGRRQTDVWEFPRPAASREHPTMKPVALIEKAVGNSAAIGAVVLDPFLGSGSTMIAAERLGRRCYGIDVDPGYVDVAVARWESFTGGEAVLEGEHATDTTPG